MKKWKNEKMKKWKILLKMNNSKFKKMKNWKNEKMKNLIKNG
jgi:hypothetical protein